MVFEADLPALCAAPNPGARCVLCEELFRPHLTASEDGLCENCLRDYLRQVQDRSPEVRRLATHLLSMHVALLRAGDSRKAGSVGWALHRLGVSGLPSLGTLTVSCLHGAQGSLTFKVPFNVRKPLAEAFGTAALVESDRRFVGTRATAPLSWWPTLVSFAEEWALGIVLPTLDRGLTVITDHLVGERVPDLRGVVGPGAAEVIETRGATLSLALRRDDGRPMDITALAALFGAQDGGAHFDARTGHITCSRCNPEARVGWAPPVLELWRFLTELGFRVPPIPVVSLAQLIPEQTLDTTGLDDRPVNTPALFRALASLGFVDTGRAVRPTFVAHHARGRSHLIIDGAAGDLILERGARTHRVPKSTARQMLATLGTLLG